MPSEHGSPNMDCQTHPLCQEGQLGWHEGNGCTVAAVVSPLVTLTPSTCLMNLHARVQPPAHPMSLAQGESSL
jgi:hypothetical protein